MTNEGKRREEKKKINSQNIKFCNRNSSVMRISLMALINVVGNYDTVYVSIESGFMLKLFGRHV